MLPKIDTSTDPQVGYRPLGALDAQSALQSYAGSFGTRHAAHLLRRAGFGGSSAEIARFLAETGNAFRSAHGMVRNELERDKSPKVRISCLIDHAHTAFTQFSNDFVTGYSPGLMPWVYIELHGKRT